MAADAKNSADIGGFLHGNKNKYGDAIDDPAIGDAIDNPADNHDPHMGRRSYGTSEAEYPTYFLPAAKETLLEVLEAFERKPADSEAFVETKYDGAGGLSPTDS